MSHVKPSDRGSSGSSDSSSISNMVNRHGLKMPSTCQIGEANSASGSRSGRESGNGCNDCNGVCVIDNLTDHNCLRSNRSRPLARLDRLLRRWLPGYNFIRCAFANCNSGADVSNASSNRPETEITSPPKLEHQKSVRQLSISVEPTLPVRKRRDGEVVLDTGIAKSEFCMKLEKLLRAKLVAKD